MNGSLRPLTRDRSHPSITGVPEELRVQIFCTINKARIADIFNLGRTCRSLWTTSIPFLYSNVVVFLKTQNVVRNWISRHIHWLERYTRHFTVVLVPDKVVTEIIACLIELLPQNRLHSFDMQIKEPVGMDQDSPFVLRPSIPFDLMLRIAHSQQNLQHLLIPSLKNVPLTLSDEQKTIFVQLSAVDSISIRCSWDLDHSFQSFYNFLYTCFTHRKAFKTLRTMRDEAAQNQQIRTDLDGHLHLVSAENVGYPPEQFKAPHLTDFTLKRLKSFAIETSPFRHWQALSNLKRLDCGYEAMYPDNGANVRDLNHFFLSFKGLEEIQLSITSDRRQLPQVQGICNHAETLSVLRVEFRLPHGTQRSELVYDTGLCYLTADLRYLVDRCRGLRELAIPWVRKLVYNYEMSNYEFSRYKVLNKDTDPTQILRVDIRGRLLENWIPLVEDNNVKNIPSESEYIQVLARLPELRVLGITSYFVCGPRHYSTVCNWSIDRYVTALLFRYLRRLELVVTKSCLGQVPHGIPSYPNSQRCYRRIPPVFARYDTHEEHGRLTTFKDASCDCSFVDQSAQRTGSIVELSSK